MTVTELIEKHGSTPAIGVQMNQDIRWELTNFAVALLELVYPSKSTNANEVLQNLDKALEELRK